MTGGTTTNPRLTVPFVDLTPQHQPLRAALLAAWGEILDAGDFVAGPWIERFEAEFARACAASHTVAVSSGTDALVMAVRALGLEPGDEVIVPANTYVATAAAVIHAGGVPVFVDALADTWNLDPEALESACGPRTVGVIGVHLYGQPFDVARVGEVCRRRGLWLLEDAAQAHLARCAGRPVGGLADAAAFSFYPSKNLGAPGDGGAVVTQRQDVAQRVRQLRDHGQARKGEHLEAGYTARMSSLVAAALSLKLARLPEWTRQRAVAARHYRQRLATMADVELQAVPGWAEPVWHLMVVRVPARDRVREALTRAGIGTGVHYPTPCHLQPLFQGPRWEQMSRVRNAPGQLPVSERGAAHGLSLPLYAGIDEAAVDYVCDSLGEALQEVRR